MVCQSNHGEVRVGDRVLVSSPLGSYWDVVRGVFIQHVLLEPYGANVEFDALVLTEHSWCAVGDVLCVDRK